MSYSRAAHVQPGSPSIMTQKEHYFSLPTEYVKMQGMVFVDEASNYFNNFGSEREENSGQYKPARPAVLKCLQALVVTF